MAKKHSRPENSRWGGFDYKVEFHPKGSIEVEGDAAFGETDHTEQLIRIEDGLTPEREVALLVHEPMHQMIGTAKVVFGGTPDDIEEQVCTFVGDAISGHIRDNPDFWRYLISRLAPRRRKPKKETPPAS